MSVADDIIEKVDRKEQDTQRLRDRWASDYVTHWLLEDYKGMDKGYKVYTSNESRNYARKTVTGLSGAAMVVQVPQDKDDRSNRDEDNAKERFILGSMKANDERLALIGEPTLRQWMSFTLPNFGYTMGRCLLIKEKGRSWADATPWDPKEVTWEYGHKGLIWICHKYFALRSQVEGQWGIAKEGTKGWEAVAVYDYYDEERNIVVIPSAKDTPVKNERHGLIDQVPGWVATSSLQPPITRERVVGSEQAGVQLADSIADYGESIYAENRSVWETHNFNMSILKELAHRSLKPVFGIRSQSGVVVVEGDPFAAGKEIPLRDGQELIVYDFIRAAGDMGPFMTAAMQEMQRGGYPVIMYGDAPVAISGYAMNTLRSGVADKIVPLAQAKSTALRQIANIWCDHFVAGGFGALELNGQGRNRRWFSSTITPDMLRDLPEAEITITPELPEDTAQKIQQAMILRQAGANGMPLQSDYVIREEYLQRQDSDMDYDAILQEMAMQHPLVQAHRFTDALAKRGDEAAQYWQAQWMQIVMQMMQQGLPLQGVQPPQGATGFSPEVLPNIAQGIPPPMPGVETPNQAGPLVPPGTERPGAQNGRIREGFNLP